ncbi:Uncharacterized conserved protein YutE, UPF0331/DUF86 family [Lentibacillus halodurans]|uniref:Uncharacterized conserved protein YutE, UPF0331/DUF86 family n=1 Tax=Lentibacillus halodurans TaxID=237679 RepID=A0A1I0WST5_9BACI|nr:DUF86 domain-containing protein [Lentibacillus halodurans]SFA91210.1 Uncharacterized conserved protein YutE, UPF0331/DUF86 family [Lentibacillus halodurans]
MYFVERKKIEETLTYMEKLLNEIGRHSFHTFADKLYLERTVHMVIESMLDVGNMMIDGFIMRDPGSFDDIIDILIDEKVLLRHEEEDYKAVIGLRRMVVKDYLQIDHDTLAETMRTRKRTLDQFSSRIRTYLDSELGVANAFTNE